MTSKYEEHPAWGMAAFHRVSGSPRRLFGTHLEQHGHFISLVIKHGRRKRDLGQDCFAGGKTIVEVWLSAAQFAEMLTTMNIGDGVPCTIRAINGEMVPKMSRDDILEHESVKNEFAKQLCKANEDIKKALREAEIMLQDKTSITKKDRVGLMSLLNKIDTELQANLPFYLEQFQHSAEKVVTAAKAEIDAVLTHTIQIAGAQHLGLKPLVLELEAQFEKKEDD